MGQKHPGHRIGWTMVARVIAVMVSATALAGCGGVADNPGGPSGTGAPTVQAQAVPASVRAAVVKALTVAKVRFDAASVTVSYGRDTDQATVTGVLQARPGIASVVPTTATGLVGYGEIDLTLMNGKWVVTGSNP
jgi:hypothetical protein